MGRLEEDLKCYCGTLERFDKNILERIEKLDALLKNPIIAAIINCGQEASSVSPILPVQSESKAKFSKPFPYTPKDT